MYKVRSLVPVESGAAECSKCGEGKLEYAVVRSTRGEGSWFAFHCRTCLSLFDAREEAETDAPETLAHDLIEGGPAVPGSFKESL